MRSLRSYAPTPLRRLAAWVLPLPSRLLSLNVSDVHNHTVRQGIGLDVYWLAEPVGPGPGASLMVFGDEVMRFDCIGPKRGHMHLNIKQIRGFPGGTARLYYREQTFEQQIERSCFEFENNLAYALQTNVSARLRRLRFAPKEITDAAIFLRRQMYALLAEHRPELRPGSAGSPSVRETEHETLEPRRETQAQ